MHEEILKEIGLSPNEAKIYETLVKAGQSTVQQISDKSKVHRRNVYDSLSKLTAKGLVSESFIKGEKIFKATAPTRLLDLLKEKEAKLNQAIPDLEKEYNKKPEEVEAYFYKGIEGFKNYLKLILETKETVHFIGAKAFWLDQRLQFFLPHFEKERKKLGIKFKHIFDNEIKTKRPEILKLVGKPYKFLPKEYSSNTAVDIFGPYVVTFVGVKPGELFEDPLMFVLKNQMLADGYRKYFKFIWDFCPEGK